MPSLPVHEHGSEAQVVIQGYVAYTYLFKHSLLPLRSRVTVELSETLSHLLFHLIFAATLVAKHGAVLILVKDQFPVLTEALKHSLFLQPTGPFSGNTGLLDEGTKASFSGCVDSPWQGPGRPSARLGHGPQVSRQGLACGHCWRRGGGGTAFSES